ncbi:MAG TPA: polysaccharide deacetylase family protein [Thermodesulfobacteriota bacterium]|nr:polysaccharide deacetylase family protein [Thermodesulfobacteriota bacterium]
MQKNKSLTILLLTLFFILSPSGLALAQGSFHVPILIYHRIGPVATDSMTVTTALFESQLKYFKDNKYEVIPLRQLVDYYLTKKQAPPPHSVVITADDGHISVYREMLPLVKKYHIPVTLFIYPSAISNASYAMTWGQLRELKETGLFDFQSHTFWHPNFKKEKKRLIPAEYENFVAMQMRKSKEKLEKELNVRVDMLGWPFGIYDDDLIRKAKEAGYVATFTMERHSAGAQDNVMALPRYLMTNGDGGRRLATILANSPRG